MTHIMLDIETLGVKPGCVVMSIGACTFDPYGVGHGETFYQNIDQHDSRNNWGLKTDPETVKWWENQSEEAISHLLTDRVCLYDAINAFFSWFFDVDGQQVWCHGAAFDAPIMEALFEVTKCPIPWRFWDIRDTRTVYDISSFDTITVERKGTYHNALHDAIHQVNCMQAALKNLKEKSK